MPIMKEMDLLESKVLETEPNRQYSGMKAEEYPTLQDKKIIKGWNNEAMFCTVAPYILGYTGFIPGRNDRHTYGMTFMKAVEVGGKEWHKTQLRLWEQDAIRAHDLIERTNPTHLVSGARADNVDFETDDGDGKDRKTYDYHVDSEKPPILGYTGHIPGARLEVDHSKGYGESARIGFRGVQKERDSRNLLSQARTDNEDFEINDGYGKDRKTYDYHVDPEKPPIFGYTGHIPGARLEVDHSKGYGESARIGFRGVQKERDERHAKEDMVLAPISCH